MTAPVLTFVLARRRKQKTRLLGRVVVTTARRTLTHHSLNGANNQRNRDKAVVHRVKHDLWGRRCQLLAILSFAMHYKLRLVCYVFCLEWVSPWLDAQKTRFNRDPANMFRETF